MPRRAGLLVIASLLALCASGCVDITVPDCWAQDVFFTEEADDESVAAELSLADCVSGDIWMENTVVSELSLPLLESVGGSFIISGNISLERIDLPLLTNVGQVLEVSENPLLVELSLPALAEVGGSLIVTGNDELTTAEAEQTFADVDVGGERVFRP